MYDLAVLSEWLSFAVRWVHVITTIAFTATIMTANVFLIIMPNQRIIVADLKAGRTQNNARRITTI